MDNKKATRKAARGNEEQEQDEDMPMSDDKDPEPDPDPVQESGKQLGLLEKAIADKASEATIKAIKKKFKKAAKGLVFKPHEIERLKKAGLDPSTLNL